MRNDGAESAERKTAPDLFAGQRRFLLAVAVGFEPTVTGYATLAFEASSFGRSDTLPREILAHGRARAEIGSGATAGGGQPVRKKAVRGAAHSSARTPSTTSGRWLRRRSRRTSHMEPAAPAFSSRAP